MLAVRRFLVQSNHASARGLASLTFEQNGAPSKVLKYDAKAVTPKTPGSNEVSVKVSLAPVLLEDLRTVRGISLINSVKSGIAGTNAIGRIGGSGDLVLVADTAASWADTITTSRDHIYKLDKISEEEASTLPALVSAWRILQEIHAKSDDHILQADGDSSIGQALIQIGKANNINIISLSSTELADPKFPENFKSKGIKVSNAVAGTSGKHLHALLKVLSAKGKLVLYQGIYQNLDVVTGIDVPVGRQIFQGLQIYGFDYHTWRRQSPDQFQTGIKEVLQLLQQKKISLKPTVYKIAEYNKAIEEVEKTGKLSVLKF